MEQIQFPNLGGNRTCMVCRDPNLEDIHQRLLNGESVAHVGDSLPFSRRTLRRHIDECLKISGSKGIREMLRVRSAIDVENRFEAQYTKLTDALDALEKVMIVEDDISFDPRAWEVSVVYQAIDEEGKPYLKKTRLDKLISRLEETGITPVQVYLKQEDFRKTYRDLLSQLESITDKFARLTGAYKREGINPNDELERARELCQRVAIAKGWTYGEAVKYFLEDQGARLRPDLRGMLEKESQESPHPLPAASANVFALPAPTTVPAEMIQQEAPIKTG